MYLLVRSIAEEGPCEFDRFEYDPSIGEIEVGRMGCEHWSYQMLVLTGVEIPRIWSLLLEIVERCMRAALFAD